MARAVQAARAAAWRAKPARLARALRRVTTTKNPATESCLVVRCVWDLCCAPTGDDSHAGSLDEPVKTISKAIELAQAAGKFVLACEGTYDEQLKLTSSATLYGGFSCPGAATAWSYQPGKKAKVAPSAQGFCAQYRGQGLR